MKGHALLLAFIAFVPAASFATISMTYPTNTSANQGSTIEAGFVAPGQSFTLAFSDKAGDGSSWSSLSLPGMPRGWEVVSTAKTDASLSALVKVPDFEDQGTYSFPAALSTQDGSTPETVTISIQVKRNLVGVSFVKKSADTFYLVGGKVIYTATISNSSVAPVSVRLSSTLPGNWYREQSVEVDPQATKEAELVVVPQTSGTKDFSFQAFAGDKGEIVRTFSSEIDVKPTLKGELVAPDSGFPFLTFSLLPFQLFNSFLGILLQ